MNPLLYRVGPFLIYSYTVVLSLGILAATGLTGWLAKKDHIEKWFDAVLVCLLFGLIGGRVAFIWANWNYFQDHNSSITKVWQGGYSYYGALAAGIIGLWLWAKYWLTAKYWQRKRQFQQAQSTSFPAYADLLAPGLALLCAFGWLACWFEGCAYGAETTISFFAANLPDEFSIFAVRYQTQLMGMVWSLFVFAFAMFTRTRWHTGQLFWLTLAILSLGHISITLLRGDPVPMVNLVRLDLIINGTIVLISALFVVNYWNRIKRS